MQSGKAATLNLALTIMFEDDHGNFTRKDPTQPDLDLRIADDATGTLKEVG